MSKDKMKKEARTKMLKELKKAMRDDIHEPLREGMKGLKKVTVASDSEEGLEEGLSKAQKILKKKEEMGEDFACGGPKDKYKEGGYKMPDEVKEAQKKVMSKADKIMELAKKKKKK
jgi:hypothetical protein